MRVEAWPSFGEAWCLRFDSPAYPLLGGRTEEYGLSDRQSTDASDRSVDSRVVLVRANDRLQHFRRGACGFRIKVHHRAANVAQRDGDGRGVVRLAELEHTAQPLVLLEGNRPQ